MTVTNNERREVAKRLREIRPCKSGHIKWWEIARALGLKQPAGWFGWEKFEPDSANRLADLIDPGPDLTCELEPTASERTDAPVRVYECDCCGRSCDSVYAEDYVYCPYCGRLNTAREVEVEP